MNGFSAEYESYVYSDHTYRFDPKQTREQFEEEQERLLKEYLNNTDKDFRSKLKVLCDAYDEKYEDYPENRYEGKAIFMFYERLTR